MKDWSLAFLAGMGSAALLGGALYFQYVLGMAPCSLCMWQRWPHAAAVVFGVLAWVMPSTWLAWGGAMAAATSGGIGIYHTGVERGWFQGPTACSGTTDLTRLSAEEMLDRILAAPVVRCDEVAWEMAGLSMASWNAVASFALVAVWVVAARRLR